MATNTNRPQASSQDEPPLPPGHHKHQPSPHKHHRLPPTTTGFHYHQATSTTRNSPLRPPDPTTNPIYTIMVPTSDNCHHQGTPLLRFLTISYQTYIIMVLGCNTTTPPPWPLTQAPSNLTQPTSPTTRAQQSHHPRTNNPVYPQPPGFHFYQATSTTISPLRPPDPTTNRAHCNY